MNASRAFLSAFNEQALVPVQELGWDTYEARLYRYAHNASVVNGTLYSSINRYAAAHLVKSNLYRHIRPVYSPASRLVDLYVAYVMGGSLDLESMTGGAIPIVTSNKALLDAIRQGFIWSRWGELKSLYVRTGATYGDVLLNVVDDRDSRKVRMEVLHPGIIRAADFDGVGNFKMLTLEDERVEDDPVPKPGLLGSLSLAQTKTYTYTQIIEHENPGDKNNPNIRFRTFKDGKSFAFYRDGGGQWVDEWTEPYGFIPAVLVKHQDIGLNFGASSFQNSLRKIDEVNDFASLLNDQVRKSVNVMWYFAGVGSKDELDAGVEKRDQTPAIYGPADSQPYPMIANMPIGEALLVLQEMIAENERDNPELALQRIRDGGSNMTAPGIRAGYSDGIGRIVEGQGNYGHGLIRGVQMLVSIGGYNGYDNFQSFNLDSYAAGKLDFTIKHPPVINDTLALTERLLALATVSGQTPSMQKIMLEEMGYSKTQIDEVIAEAQAEAERKAQAARELSARMSQGQPNRAPGNNGAGQAQGVTAEGEAVNA